MNHLRSYHYEIIVLIPHFNNPSGLERSLKSLSVNESMAVMVIDDGSAKNKSINAQEVESILDKKKIDFVIQFNSKNKGIEYALNAGLSFIQKKLQVSYIARLDCGDLIINNRFEKQFNYLETNPEVGLVGSYVRYFDNEETLFTLKLPVDHESIKKNMMLGVSFIHPAVMFRCEALDTIGHYPVDFKAAEDYAYFMLFVKKFKTANLPEVLTLVEYNTDGITSRNRRTQLKTRLRIIWKYRNYSFYFFVGVLKVLILLIIPKYIILKMKKVIYK